MNDCENLDTLTFAGGLIFSLSLLKMGRKVEIHIRNSSTIISGSV